MKTLISLTLLTALSCVYLTSTKTGQGGFRGSPPLPGSYPAPRRPHGDRQIRRLSDAYKVCG
jgi:hypothetical protein